MGSIVHNEWIDGKTRPCSRFWFLAVNGGWIVAQSVICLLATASSEFSSFGGYRAIRRATTSMAES